LGICGGVAALFGIDLLRLVTLENVTAMRCVLAVNGVSALFLIFALIAFKPFKGL
jgi:phage shock protein PspC (stress-responsive transcriptional regulator)